MVAVAPDSKRVFILGPSHHVYLRNCALSSQTHYETPIGDLVLDLEGASKPTLLCGLSLTLRSQSWTS